MVVRNEVMTVVSVKKTLFSTFVKPHPGTQTTLFVARHCVAAWCLLSPVACWHHIHHIGVFSRSQYPTEAVHGSRWRMHRQLSGL